MSEFNQSDTSNNQENQSKSVQKRKRVVNTKPDNFKETEQLAKKMLNADGINYYEWLDKKHKEVVFDKMIKNQDVIVDALEFK